LELVHEQRIDKHEPFQPIRILGTFYIWIQYDTI
jgi:hypothetical protein